MKTVFLGGSRRISRLDESIRSKLDEFVRRGLWICVGDAYGADRAMQKHLADRGYDRVIVYSVTGNLRNNIGGWQVRFVDAPSTAKGFDRFAVKDVRMAGDASYGLMLWDGKSRGTLANIHNLLDRGKPVAVYVATARRFVALRSPGDLRKIGLDPRHGPSKQQRLPLEPDPGAIEHTARN